MRIHVLVLGVTHPISWNSAACVLRDGRLVAFAEEERFTRWKHSARLAPVQSIAYCLREAGATLAEVDHLAIGWEDGDRQKRKRRWPWNHLAAQLPWSRRDRRARYVRHHRAHAASAYYCSGFDRACVITLDGYGGSDAGMLGVGEGDDLRELRLIAPKESWGRVYGDVTTALGFRFHSEESKVMALAATGTPDPDRFDFVDWDADVPTIRAEPAKAFLAGLPVRAAGAPLTTEHRDLAATLQRVYERALLRMAEWLHRETGIRRVALAGGCALNCAANGMLARAPFVDDIFVQPAAHDGGTALGAAVAVYRDVTGHRPPEGLPHAFFGPRTTTEEAVTTLRACGVTRFHVARDAADEIAQRVADGQLVGVVRGRMEMGPRALGGRSILADPRRPEMRERLNREVKGREEWNPFAPAILEEAAATLLTRPAPSRFMALAVETTPQARDTIPAAVHVDGTARPQTVPRPGQDGVAPEAAPLRPILERFAARTGVPALVNTSFNLPGDPIVCTPRDALAAFFASPLDALALEDVIVEKTNGRPR